MKWNTLPSLTSLICLTTILCSCKQVESKTWKEYGYFGSAKYFDNEYVNADYTETFVLKIDTGIVTLYGTVQTWGANFNYTFSSNNDTLLLERELKIYAKDDSSIYFEYSFNDSLDKEKFKLIPNLSSVINSDGIDREMLGELLAHLQLVGKYHYQDEIVEFRPDGTVSNFDKFKKYKIRPRLGTLTYYDNRIIETDNGIWRFSKTQGDLMLTKYSDKRDENEMFELSNEKVLLQR